MTDFLTNLVGRTLGMTPTVQPLVAPRYAPDAKLAVAPFESYDPPLAATALPAPAGERAQSATTAPRPARPASSLPGSDQADAAPLGPTEEAGVVSITLGSTTSQSSSTAPPFAADPERPLLPTTLHQPADNASPRLSHRPEAQPPAPLTADSANPDALLVQPAFKRQATAPPTNVTEALEPFLPESTIAGLTLVGLAQPRLATPREARAPAQTIHKHVAAPPQQNSPAAPTIQVTIGRIEIRATGSPVTPARKANPAPVMSLEEYMHARKGGNR